MSDIGAWLEALGLGEFVEAFEAERIEPEILPDLTEQHLEAMGLPLGPRLKIVKAAQCLRLDGKEASDDQRVAPEPSQTQQITLDAERRQLTVMFCDLVGSTALGERLDPEDLRALMASYRQAASVVVDRFGGHIAQYLGDGLMVYFGWPHAHEDDAARAVRAGLDIVAAIKHVAAPTPLQVRIGIATGQVVVGDSTDDDAQANRLAIGETPNLASRLQGLAGPDQIIIGPGTHRLTGGAFEYEELGERDLKGILEPVRSWRVKGASAAEGRFEAQATGGLTPFIGRESELQLLIDRWQQACHGEGQVALLAGEPGIGKSRLTQQLQEQLTDVPHVRLRYQCSPYHTNSAFHPIIEQIERAAGFARADSPDVRLDKLEALFDGAPMTLIAALMSLPLDRYPPHNLSPQRRKDDTVAALTDRVIHLAAEQPVFVLFEDAHWCDPTTLETLTALVARIESAPVLMVITFRPEFDPPWTGYGHVVLQSLSRLGRGQGADMVEKVSGGKAIPKELRDQIISKTDGVPLFVEELTKAVLEADFLKDAGDRYELDGPLPPLAVPSTLQDSLMARLDRLGPVKEVAQIGACIGRAFSHDLLASVSSFSEIDLQDALHQLVDSELIFQRGTPPEATYLFKHALVQDAAHESLLKSRRQQLHAAIAETLEAMQSDPATTEPELLARHLTEAGLPSRALPAWLNAANNALGRNAVAEAIEHTMAGLALVDRLDDHRQRQRHEVDLLSIQASARMIANGYPSDAFEETLLRADQICRDAGFLQNRLGVLWGLSQNALNHADYELGNQRVRELMAVAEDLGTEEAKVAALANASTMAFWSGDLAAADAFAKSAVSLSPPGGHADLTMVMGHDPRSLCQSFIASIALQRGYIDRAVETADQTIQAAEQAAHDYNLAWVLLVTSQIHFSCGNRAKAVAQIERAARIGEEGAFYIISNYMMYGYRAGAKSAAGEFQSALDDHEKWLSEGEAIGLRTARQWGLIGIAGSSLGLGKIEDAWSTIQRAINHCQTYDEHLMRSEVYRVAGEIARARQPDDLAVAESYFHQALSVARDRSLKYLELSAAASLARLWGDMDKRQDAHDLLAPVYGWFTEGLDTAVPKAAKALLETLE